MSKKNREEIAKRLERGRADLNNRINSSLLTEGDPVQTDYGVTQVSEEEALATANNASTYALPSAADRIEGIVSTTASPMMPSLADRAERGAAISRARSQAEMQPSAADRSERLINQQMNALLTEEERTKFSPAAVRQLNLQEERIAREVTPTVEPEEEVLSGGMFSIDTGLNDFIAEQRAQQTVTRPPVESLKGQTERKAFVIDNYPTLMAAADRANLSDSEVRDLVNFTLAFDAARLIGETVFPERQAAIFATMSKPMQALVVDILNAGIKQDEEKRNTESHTSRILRAQEEGRAATKESMAGLSTPVNEYIGSAIAKAQEQQKIIGEESTGRVTQDIARTLWNWSAGPVIDFLFTSAEQTARAVRAANLYVGTELGNYRSWDEAWNAAEQGQFSQDRLNEIKKVYGEKPVNLIVEIMSAKNSGDSDIIGTVIEKYQDDPEMLDFIDKAINGARADQEMADLITSVRSAETGDTGNVIAMAIAKEGAVDVGVGEYEQSRIYSATRDVTNVAAVFALDPLVLLGVARGGMLAARYGMGRVALEMNAPVKGTKVFQMPRVQTFMRTLGSQLQDVNRVEATDGVAAMAPLNASVRSSYKRFFTPEALDDMRIFMKSNARDGSDPAAVLEEYFSNVENLQHIIVGQSARRWKQVQVPHMTEATARVKLFGMKLRGLTYPRLSSNEFLDGVFFPGFSQSLPSGAADDLAKIISSEGGDKYVGRALSDFTIRDGEMVRNLTGRLVLDRLPKTWKFAQRYGWKRSHTPAAIAARARRLAAIWPDTSRPLKVTDASDAQRIQQLVEAAGMPRHFSLVMREIWVAADPASRRMIGEGIARSYGYARGIDVVSQEGKKFLDDIAPGAPRGDQYAASMPNMAELQGQATKLAKERIGLLSEEARGQIKVSDLANTILREELLPNAGKYNPSMINGRANAITLSDTTDYMAFPNINNVEGLTARSSLLTALTGQNAGMSNVTDFWVLGTLAGPRFQLRNGVEDMGLYLATTGSFRDYLKGRSFSTARREATERARKNEFAEPKRMQLGMVKAFSRTFGDLFSDNMAALILPNLSKQDRALANNLARQGDREALAQLVGKAIIRQRLRFLPGSRRIIGRTLDESKLSPKEMEELRWLEQAVKYGDVLHAMDEAAETSRHLADGFPAKMDDMNDPSVIDFARNGDVIKVNGQNYKVHEYTVSYEDVPVYNASNQSIQAWYNNISKILHGDGPKGQWTMQLLPRYYRATYAGKSEEVENIVNELAERIASADESWGYGTRFMIQQSSGFDGLARASLDNAMQLFTTQNGRFNRELFKRVQVKSVREDGTEYTKYALWDIDEAGEKLHFLTRNDLVLIPGKPLYVNAPSTIKITEQMGQAKWTNATWAWMGRSLARMTREPIFTANYLDARRSLDPFEKKLTDILGPEGAEKWAVEAATERAFRLTMNYVDNPNVRSQFAWQIRNVARFYRALEDFNRRMVRTARNEPMALYKVALAWNALDDSGFVWEDEFGEKYFVWPGTRVGFEAINGILNMFNLEAYSPSLPLAFTSRVNMIAPSADPNAMIPTFSGPYAALAVMPLMRALPGLRGLENEFFGDYSGNQTVWEAAFPAHVVRVMNYFQSQRGSTESRLNETDTMFANAARSAALAYAAAGMWRPGQSYSAEEIEKHRVRIDQTAQWILGLKLALSPVAIASLNLNVDTATDFAKTLNIDGMRPAFVQVLKANNGDINAAAIQWIKTNPDLSPFIVGTTQSPETKGYYGPFEETVRWVEDNSEAVEISALGASYFAPTTGRQTPAAWNFLAASGIKTRTSVDTYIKEIMNAEGLTLYYSLRSQWIEAKRNGDKRADAKFDEAKERLYSEYPNLQSAISGQKSTSIQSSVDDMRNEVDSIRKVANYLKDNNKLDTRGKNILNLVNLRDQLDMKLQRIDPNSVNESKEKDRLRDNWRNVLNQASYLYPDDRQFRNLLYTLSESLVQGWGRYV